MPENMEMYLGEVRDIQFTISSRNRQPFTIRNLSWELRHGDVVEATGTAEAVEGPERKSYTATVTVAPETADFYLVVLRFDVADEHLISKKNLIVKE